MKLMNMGKFIQNIKNGYLKPGKDKNGYLKLALSGNEKPIYVRIATLVAYNFIGEPPKEMKDPTIDHIDNNILNNHYTNLRWLERSENSSIRKKQGKSLGELNHEAKLKEKEVIEICELLLKNNLTLKQIGEIYKVSRYTINNIKRKQNWKHITKHYNFSNLKENSMDLKEFLKKYCKDCKEKCDKGLIEKKKFIRCIDRDIFVKKAEENKK